MIDAIVVPKSTLFVVGTPFATQITSYWFFVAVKTAVYVALLVTVASGVGVHFSNA